MGKAAVCRCSYFAAAQVKIYICKCVWMCPKWVIVHANRWLNRQLSNLHEQMEVVPIQKAGGTWTLCKQAAGLKACGNLVQGPHSCLNPRASWGLKLHKWNLLFDLSCHGDDQISGHLQEVSWVRGLIPAISFHSLDIKQKFQLSVLLW